MSLTNQHQSTNQSASINNHTINPPSCRGFTHLAYLKLLFGDGGLRYFTTLTCLKVNHLLRI